MDVLPSLNQPIHLVGDDGEEYPSRVEGIEGALMTVARPLGLPPETSVAVGGVVDLGWHTEQAAFRRPVRVLVSKREGNVPLWDIEMIGPATKIQRRAHVRVPVGSAMTIATEGADATVSALLVDVSEAALRCRVEPADVPAAGDEGQPEPLAVGQPVEVSFSLAGTDFHLPAAVYRNDPVGGGTRELVLSFVIDEGQATDVRKAIFAEQVRLRQLRTDR